MTESENLICYVFNECKFELECDSKCKLGYVFKNQGDEITIEQSFIVPKVDGTYTKYNENTLISEYKVDGQIISKGDLIDNRISIKVKPTLKKNY